MALLPSLHSLLKSLTCACFPLLYFLITCCSSCTVSALRPTASPVLSPLCCFCSYLVLHSPRTAFAHVLLLLATLTAALHCMGGSLASILNSFHGERTIFMSLRKSHHLIRKGLASWKFATRRTNFAKFTMYEET